MKFFNKSQIKMFETIAILFIFFILLVLGLIFYANVRQQQTRETTREYRELKAIENMQKLMFLPEIQCSETGREVYTCADALKLEALEEIIEENPIYYADLFGNSEIVVYEVYGGEGRWTITNRTQNVKGKIPASFIPITVYNPVSDKYNLGILRIRTA